MPTYLYIGFRIGTATVAASVTVLAMMIGRAMLDAPGCRYKAEGPEVLL